MDGATNFATKLNNRRRLRADVPIPIQINIPGLDIGPDDRVVDVGCGDGVVCVHAGLRGAEVVGIDLNPDYVAQVDTAMADVPARSWRGIVSDCAPIPLPDGFASVVVASEILEHVPDPARFLAELVRIGQPGARYVIAVPDPASEALMKLVAPRAYWEPPFHIHVYEHDELDALIRGAGLSIEARASRGFEYTFTWACRFAASPDIHDLKLDEPLLHHWQEAWAGLMSTPRGPQLAEALDRLIPKSQLVLARKPGTPSASSLGGPVWSRSRWRRRLRDGVLNLAGFDLRWSIRRVRNGGE